MIDIELVYSIFDLKVNLLLRINMIVTNFTLLQCDIFMLKKTLKTCDGYFSVLQKDLVVYDPKSTVRQCMLSFFK